MQMISAQSKGVFVIAATPFLPSGEIDLASTDKMVDFYFEKGADGLTILGMMGEAPKLTHSEALSITKQILKRAGDKPVVVGVSAPGLAAIGELTKAVMDEGAAGVMVAPPGSLRTNEQIIAYYANVVQTVDEDVPIVLQDFPLATGVHISSATLGTIFENHANIVMLKHEDWPGLQKISDLRAAEEKGRRRVSILCGNAGVFLPEEMARGADGAMTGFAYPEMMVKVCRLSNRGETDKARDLFDAYLPLMRYEQQPALGLAVRKYVLAKRGVIAHAAQRKPGADLSPLAAKEVDILMDRLEKRLSALR
ncbi:dihydrodipicolinate synthase family protein [Maritalea porphyrae]|uniref:Dihydrodipicolinate synthase family protein n=1 Tax=Maritalea porphyrae TaxID=880732 RepID=A0ABQ5UP93_9HYPH|nr:dihydrodipicolinate synthase family protein [Maritalea porphyrae]GLQ17111.1 dihydrodipicolinate synthase family protein [Maritalea porphyrae]